MISAELTGSGLKLMLASGEVTLALAAGPDAVTLIIADPAALVGFPPKSQPVGLDYRLDLTAARHLKERLALVIAEAEGFAGVEDNPVEPLALRRSRAA